MRSAISRKASNKQQKEPKPAWGWRVIGLLLGLVLTLVGAGFVVLNGVQGVQATGLVGTRGTFKVDYCTDTNPSRKNSDYECGGAFTPRGGDIDDGQRGKLENAEDYPAGEKLDVVESWIGSGSRFRETGVGATLLSIWFFCIGAGLLAMGVATFRKWARSYKK
ncbi:hypothetical protein [Streptomyces lydicus]|uniref:hypothetical protein n=1 Tax=Streptomyces lydicus TaxID=47763 RepID=UPI0010131A77|nr:hypothetical protein [Streptomyces lydicus]MCZ1010725.1 hypothetical protein [Streptomyces lydicus]